MIRTLISLEEKDKRWLDWYSRRRGQSAAETVREAIRQLKDADSEQKKTELLDHTAGMWKQKGVDAIDYVDRIRNEW
ncbi:MAG: hypothetical protein HN368_07380 [Spirochaetales bacterium]|jgi:hypothetical protein|nr:hypothetical protein [Spirochaetales bacterium]